MFLHIGADYAVPIKDIAMILDCETELPESTQKTLSTLESICVGGAKRSAVLTKGAVYYSPIAKETLRKRIVTSY